MPLEWRIGGARVGERLFPCSICMRELQKEIYQLKSTGISLFDLVSGVVY
ncbi:MAG: hypothetical protein K2G55_04870 [Lachnospiraceae bacterium]|nr:hypothetical protein [Lachnospiraceae bacterium]MDE7205403.1 hypothetical protein [Lachnospiraceae bacterium]